MRKLVFVCILGLLGITFQNCSQQPAQEKFCADLKAENFQTTINGKKTDLYFLKNGDILAAITNYGGRIVSLGVPDRNGERGDVVLGFSSIDDYLNASEVFHGSLIERLPRGLPRGQSHRNQRFLKTKRYLCVYARRIYL